jgi:hypothetical protein
MHSAGEPQIGPTGLNELEPKTMRRRILAGAGVVAFAAAGLFATTSAPAQADIVLPIQIGGGTQPCPTLQLVLLLGQPIPLICL